MSRVRVWSGPLGALCRRSIAGGALGAALLGLAAAPEAASAYTAVPAGGQIVVATGNASDDVAVSAALDGRVVVEVPGQALSGSAAPCAYDADLEQLVCPAGTAIRLELGGGDDTADVSGGVQVIAFGGTGNDTVDGAVGAYGEDGDDRFSMSAGPGARRAAGDAGDDVLEVSGSSGGDVAMDGGDGRDLLDASQASGAGVVLRGEEGPDEIRGAVGPSTLEGGAGDDVLDDSAGAGTAISGGDGAEAVTVSGAGVTVETGAGDDRVDANAATGPVRVDGGPGANVVQVTAAGSAVTTGDGPDTIDAAGATGAIAVDSGAGDDRVDLGGAGSSARTGDGLDVIDTSSAAGAVRIDSGPGPDQVVLGGAGSTAEVGDGDDVIDATGVRDASHVDGGAGQDRIAVGGSGSTAAGGDGDDQLDAADATGPATLDGGAGADGLIGGPAGDALRGGDGDDRLDGGSGGNRLEGGAGQDTLLAGAGGSAGDVLSGGPGGDRVSYEAALFGVRVTVGGGGGDDGGGGEADDVQGDVEQVDGSDADDTLMAGPAGTVLTGAEGDDVLLGAPGRDVLAGGPGDDRLDGGPGVVRDEFEGGTGDDEISYAARTKPVVVDMRSRAAQGGEAGEDDVYRDAFERIVGGAGADTITGLSGAAHLVTGGSGDDIIRMTESAGASGDASGDTVRCQGGRDAVESDTFDTVATDCERVLVDRRLERALTVFSKRSSIRLSRDGRHVSVKLGCDRDTLGYCSLKVVIRRPGTKPTLARVDRVRVMRGRWRRVSLRATGARSAATLKRSDHVLVVVVARDRLGRGSIAKKLVRPHRPRLKARSSKTGVALRRAATARSTR